VTCRAKRRNRSELTPGRHSFRKSEQNGDRDPGGAARSAPGPSDPRGTEDFGRGDRVECRYRGAPSSYTGSVSSIEGGYLSIDYDDGDKERITPGLCAHFSGQGSGCSKDADCKGDRICENRTCRIPGGPVVPQ
jgi:hypothetical protein